MYQHGTGWARFYKSVAGSNLYQSPSNDQGTLAQQSVTVGSVTYTTYTYTSVDKTTYTFNSNYELVTVKDPRGLTVSYSYNISKQLTLVQEPDGGLATFNYSGSSLYTIQEPGGYTVTLSHSGAGDISGIQDPDGGLRSLTYDTSHRLTNDQFGPLSGTVAYSTSNGELASIALAAGSTLTFAPANTVALGGPVSPNQIIGTTTDPYNYTTSYALDLQGRLTGLTLPDGGAQTWTLNLAGNPVAYTDALGHQTTYKRNDAQDVIKVTYADNASMVYGYDPTYQEVLTVTDGLGNVTSFSYNSTGDLTSVQEPALGITTYTWSNGLMQTMTD